jgi:hypothetical protein
MFKYGIVLALITSSSFGFDIEKFLDKNATETSSYKEFIQKNGTSSYHTCKNGIMFEISHSPYDSAPKEKMKRNIMLNPIKCEK